MGTSVCDTVCVGTSAYDTICVGTFSSGEAYNQQCTSDRPLTIQNAITGAQPADTVLVFPGTFTGGVTDDIDWWSAATPDGQPNTVENAARNVRLNFMGKNLQPTPRKAASLGVLYALLLRG